MESTKKKSTSKSRSSPVDVAEKEKTSNIEEEIVQTSAPTTKTKKTKSTTTKKSKSSSSSSSTASSQDVNMETESEIEPSQTTPITSTTTTTTTTSSSNGTTASTSIPTTPISKYIPSLSQMGTPLSPNRAALRLKEKDELTAIKVKLQQCIKKLESTENELEKKTQELADTENHFNVTLNALKNRSESLDKQLSEEIKIKSELMSERDALESELKTKEATWKKDQDEYISKLSETINKLNQEHSVTVSQLKTDITAKEYEMETLRNEITRLKDDLQYRMRESEDKSRKLLDNEYGRMKQKEEEFNLILLNKDDEIKKLKLELKEKEKLQNASTRKENELNQLLQAHERQIEDIRDSINREWEVKAAQMLEEHHSRTIHLEQSVGTFEEEKSRFREQIELFNSQINELNIKNNELEDKVNDLNNVISQKDSAIGVLNNELEESKKRVRKHAADMKLKDSQISLLQVEINTRENKSNTYLAEINKLKAEIFAITSQTEPEILFTKEINDIKHLVNVFEKNVNKKRKLEDYEDSNDLLNASNSSSNSEFNQTSTTTTAEQQQQQVALPNGVDPEELEKFNPNTVSFSVVDTNEGFIKLSVHGDYDNGLSLSKWRLIVVKPDNSKAGFSFPEGIQPFRGIKSVTVWTGRSRPVDSIATENEFYWSRQNLWTQPVEGTIVKLVSPQEETTTVTIPNTGVYEKVVESKGSSCLIM